MSLSWSGPSKALQFHEELFRIADRVRNETRTRSTHMSQSLRQRLILQTALSGYETFKTSDGRTVSRKDLVSIDGDDVVIRIDGELREGKVTREESLTGDGDSVGIRKDRAERMLDPINVQLTMASLEREWDMLNRATTFYVPRYMMDLITDIAMKMEPEPLRETDLPAGVGLIVFESPLIVNDLDPTTGEVSDTVKIPYRAIGWRMETVGMVDTDGTVSQQPGITYEAFAEKESYFVVRKDVDEDVEPGDLDVNAWKMEESGWSFGRSWRPDLPIGVDPTLDEDGHMVVHESLSFMRRWMLAFYRLTWQRITRPEPYRPSRHQRRGYERLFCRPMEDGYLKVLHLRRFVESEGFEHYVAGDPVYTHRWMVSGHWKRQYYPTLGPARNPDGSFNEESHRLIYIEPHIRGPESGPLVIGQQVQAVVR